jgi:preprotein translocase SecE subunit
MDAKLKPTAPPFAKGEKRVSFSFIKELKEELRKVSWTTKAELSSCTKIVVLSTIVFGLGIYGVDLIIKGSLELIKWLVHFIFG